MKQEIGKGQSSSTSSASIWQRQRDWNTWRSKTNSWNETLDDKESVKSVEQEKSIFACQSLPVE